MVKNRYVVLAANHTDLIALRSVVMESREQLARRMMHLYNELAATYEDLTFVDFTRLIDPTVPHKRADYLRHKTYIACAYLRQSAAKKRKGGR